MKVESTVRVSYWVVVSPACEHRARARRQGHHVPAEHAHSIRSPLNYRAHDLADTIEASCEAGTRTWRAATELRRKARPLTTTDVSGRFAWESVAHVQVGLRKPDQDGGRKGSDWSGTNAWSMCTRHGACTHGKCCAESLCDSMVPPCHCKESCVDAPNHDLICVGSQREAKAEHPTKTTKPTTGIGVDAAERGVLVHGTADVFEKSCSAIHHLGALLARGRVCIIAVDSKKPNIRGSVWVLGRDFREIRKKRGRPHGAGWIRRCDHRQRN